MPTYEIYFPLFDQNKEKKMNATCIMDLNTRASEKPSFYFLVTNYHQKAVETSSKPLLLWQTNKKSYLLQQESDLQNKFRGIKTKKRRWEVNKLQIEKREE